MFPRPLQKIKLEKKCALVAYLLLVFVIRLGKEIENNNGIYVVHAHELQHQQKLFVLLLRVCLYSYKALQKSFDTDYHELLIRELAASHTPISPSAYIGMLWLCVIPLVPTRLLPGMKIN